MKYISNQRGAKGEMIVKDYLEKRGLEFVCSNYRSRYGEIDIIFKHKGFLVFVEAKTRKIGSKVRGIEAVNYAKIQKITKTACMYFEEIGEDLQPRFDVAEVLMDEAGNPQKVNYIENAFEVVADCACF